MTPAEKAAAAKPPRKNGPLPKERSKRRYPWDCLVRAMRISLRLAMRDVAKGCGLSIAGLSEIERGTDPQLTTARKLATFFGKTIEEIWPQLRGDSR